MTTFVDSNVLIDIFSNDPRWASWSADRLIEMADVGPLIINPIVCAEVAVGFPRLADLTDELSRLGIELRDIPLAAAHAAGQAFRMYRRNGGTRSRVLPDFLIGAHADALGVPLLTRNKQDFAALFPNLKLIAPDQA